MTAYRIAGFSSLSSPGAVPLAAAAAMLAGAAGSLVTQIRRRRHDGPAAPPGPAGDGAVPPGRSAPPPVPAGPSGSGAAPPGPDVADRGAGEPGAAETGFPPPPVADAVDRPRPRLFGILALVVLFAVLLEPLGFLPSAALFLFAAFLFLAPRRPGRAAVVTLLALAGVFAVFRLLFEVVLPEGIVPERAAIAAVEDALGALFGGGEAR